MPRKPKKKTANAAKTAKKERSFKLFAHPPPTSAEEIQKLKNETFNTKSIGLSEFCKKFNVTEDKIWDCFTRHYNITSKEGQPLRFYKRVPDKYHKQLCNFYNNPNLLVYHLYYAKIKKYVVKRYQEWHLETGYIYGEGSNEDEDNRIYNKRFHNGNSNVYLLDDLPPEYHKYNTYTLEERMKDIGNDHMGGYLRRLTHLCEQIVPIAGAKTILQFLDQKPTVQAPWSLWETTISKKFPNWTKESEKLWGKDLRKEPVVCEKNSDSLLDMSIESHNENDNQSQILFENKRKDFQNKIPFGDATKSFNNKSNLNINPASPSKNKTPNNFFDNETPEGSVDSSLVDLMLEAYNTPAFAKTPGRATSKSQSQKNGNGSEMRRKPSILITQSVKKAARKKPLTVDHNKKPPVLNFNSTEDEDEIDLPKMHSNFKNKAIMKSTPAVPKNDDDAMEDSDFELEANTNDITPIAKSSRKFVSEPKNDNLPNSNLTPVTSAPQGLKSVIEEEEEEEQESSTIENEKETLEEKTSKKPSSTLSKYLSGISEDLHQSEATKLSEIQEKSGDTDALMEEVEKTLENNNDTAQNSNSNNNNPNPIFNNPNLVQKLRAMNISPELDSSGEDFTELIDRNKKSSNQLFASTQKGNDNNITLNAKMTPIPTATPPFNNNNNLVPSDSPINSPLMKKSKPSSTPNPFNSTKSKTRTQSKLLEDTLGQSWVNSPTVYKKNKNASGHVRRSARISNIMSKSNESNNNDNNNNVTQILSKKPDPIKDIAEEKSQEEEEEESDTLNDTLSSRPAAGTVSKMAQRFQHDALKQTMTTTMTTSAAAVKKSISHKSNLPSFKKNLGTKTMSSSAFTTKESIGASNNNNNRSRLNSYNNNTKKSSTINNLVEKKTFSTHNKKYSDANNSMSVSAKKQSSSGTLLSKPIYSKNVTNQTSSSSKSAMDRAREIKIEKLRKQQEKEEQQRKVRAKAEEDRKKALELKKLKAQQQREAVKKRREEKERQEQLKRQAQGSSKSSSTHNTTTNNNTSVLQKSNFAQNKSASKTAKTSQTSKNSVATTSTHSSTTSNQIVKLSNLAKERAMNGKVEEIDENDLVSTDEEEDNGLGPPPQHNHYDATFDRPPLEALPDDYRIDDLDSGDETDDEDNPKKQIALWAQERRLFAHCNNLYKCAAHPEKAFNTDFWPVKTDYSNGDLNVSTVNDASINDNGEVVELCPLQDIFENKKDNFYRRGSTGVWKNPPRQ